MLESILIVNAQTLVIVVVSIWLVLKAKIPYGKLIATGLALLALTGVVGIAASELAMRYWPSYMSSSYRGIYVLTNLVSLINSAGLIILVYCLYQLGKRHNQSLKADTASDAH